MKMSFKPVLLATALLIAGGAQAAETISINTGADLVSGNTTFSALSGDGTLAFSDLLLGALSIANITTTSAAPGVVTETDVTIEAKAPVTTLTGSFDSAAGTFTATKVNTAGGATMTATGLLPNGKKNSATTGGSLTVTNLTVDLASKAIYADLIGGNGVGLKSQVHVWDYATIDGATTVSTADGVHTTTNSLKTLTIKQEAFDIFASSLGLTTFGKGSMAGIEDYGVINSSISVTTAAVPEPSTYAMLASGLAVLAFAAKRARRNQA